MQQSTKTLIGVILGVVVLGCIGTAGVTWFLATAVGEGLGGNDAWRADAVPERELPVVFGVRLPVKPLQYSSRSFGFQDAFFEVVVQLPPGSAEAFLGRNTLTRGERKTVAEAETLEVIRSLVPATPALEETEFELPPALLSDGGTWFLHRSGELLEGPGGEVWVHLRAFET